MKIELKLKSNPISTNSAYYKRNKSFNENSRKWRFNFFSELQSDYNQNQIKLMKNYFNSKKHMLRVCFTWYQPIDLILTKTGEISLRSMDVDNCLKIPTDCVFDKKYNDKWLSIRKGAEAKLYKDLTSLKNLDINDKFIIDTRSIKAPSNDDQFHCSIQIEALPIYQKVK
jgi:hypothetical protein